MDEPKPIRTGAMPIEGADGREICIAYKVWRSTEPGCVYVEIPCDAGSIDVIVPEDIMSGYDRSELLADFIGGSKEMRYLLEPADYIACRIRHRLPRQAPEDVLAEVLEDDSRDIRLAAMAALGGR